MYRTPTQKKEDEITSKYNTEGEKSADTDTRTHVVT